MIRNVFDDRTGNPGPSECDKMTVMTLPKKLQKERRVDSAHGSNGPRNESAAKLERVTEHAPVREVDTEENCPVIRANHIVFSAGRTGRTRVVFY